MNSGVDSRSTLERWLALVVRFWAANMTLIHRRGSNWPGFGYTATEKTELRSIAESYDASDFYLWVAGVVVVALATFAAIVTAGLTCLTYAMGGEQNISNTPAALFYLTLAMILLVSLTVGLPIAMLASAAVVGRFLKIEDPALPDRATTAYYFHKLWFQISRMAVVMLCALIPLWLVVPAGSKWVAILRLAGPILSPAISALTLVYYYSAGLKQRSPRSPE